ncbi:MAG: putative addiction module antidote protein [Proteobacteria bacterium]|nr:putative addiction module antidote protein [Pseudomonadota bacterium]
MAKAPAKHKKRSTAPYDVAEHLRTPEEMAAYLDAWLEAAPEDAAGIARALGDIARAKGMAQVAKDAGRAGLAGQASHSAQVACAASLRCS